ncbi:MAG: hypothetical protein Q7R40_16965 [Phaeospirillum sp.]|nr:hypothetical protein [Phaeospirillum sp.]
MLTVDGLRLPAIGLALGADGLGKIGHNPIDRIPDRGCGDTSAANPTIVHTDRVGHPLHRQTGNQQTNQQTRQQSVFQSGAFHVGQNRSWQQYIFDFGQPQRIS